MEPNCDIGNVRSQGADHDSHRYIEAGNDGLRGGADRTTSGGPSMREAANKGVAALLAGEENVLDLDIQHNMTLVYDVFMTYARCLDDNDAQERQP